MILGCSILRKFDLPTSPAYCGHLTVGNPISVKFSLGVNRWPRYQMPQKYCQKFQPPDYGARQTDDRRTGDSLAR